jgi:hypothetical protein
MPRTGEDDKARNPPEPISADETMADRSQNPQDNQHSHSVTSSRHFSLDRCRVRDHNYEDDHDDYDYQFGDQ